MSCLFGSKKQLRNVPDFGHVEIHNYNKFLEQSRERFYEKWDEALQISNFKDSSYSLEDYKKLKLIGSGSFGKVYLVRNIKTNEHFSLKAISKHTILKYKQMDHTKTEKLVLMSINCPFAIRMEQFFKDNSYIYFIVPFIKGGELYNHLKKFGRFEEYSAMFYVAQIILAIEYLHFMEIVYRDIKPENILMDHTGYLKLADFGFCKRLKTARTYTLCGTPEYLAPEVILNKGYGMAADWWGIGILVYELAAGYTPFRDKKTIKVYENIIKGSYKMPLYFSENLKDLIRNILQADNSKRFGNLKLGVRDIKEHKWFRVMNWQALICRKLRSPYKPVSNGDEDLQHFRRFSYESLEIASNDPYLEDFRDF